MHCVVFVRLLQLQNYCYYYYPKKGQQYLHFQQNKRKISNCGEVCRVCVVWMSNKIVYFRGNACCCCCCCSLRIEFGILIFANKIRNVTLKETLFYRCERWKVFCTLNVLLFCGNRTPQACPVSSDYWLSESIWQCWHVSNSSSKWLRFLFTKLVIKCFNEKPCTNLIGRFKFFSNILTARMFSLLRRISVECSSISFLSIKSKRNEFVGFIACSQPASQFQGNKLLKPSAKCTWQKVFGACEF